MESPSAAMHEPLSDASLVGSADPLRPLPLAELRLLAEGRRWRVGQRIAGLDSLTPVQGSIQAQHHGTALEVTAEAETIVTLCCDRCLQHYNHALRAEVHELVELSGQNDPGASTDEINLELARDGMPEGADLDDRLDPAGRFDPERWLFEQLSLRLPLVNRCGDDCPGPATWSSEPSGGDPRWAALARLGLGEPAGGGDSIEVCGSDTAGSPDPGHSSHHGPSRETIAQPSAEGQPDPASRRDTGSRVDPRSTGNTGVSTTPPAPEPGR